MRKRIDPSISKTLPLHQEGWMDLEASAEVEVTSEDAAHPIEAALLPGEGSGWRAAAPGPQTIRILFDTPTDLRLIHLVFTEETTHRAQEFVLRWSAGDDQPMQEIVRQQYNFTPISSEVEDYAVDLQRVRRIELEVNPSIGGFGSLAQLTELRFR
ncbi:MAG: carbohydrate-binding protein [Chthoniobacter sp.]|uniref:carbohydrate-binding protein n=1 Tax=Chthoniobacter sp. TaxID=2510640 RepID=UPI0032AC4952